MISKVAWKKALISVNHQWYSNAMICDQMTVGLYDKDIQQEVLARDKTLDTLDKRYELISAYEKSRLMKSQLESGPASSSTNAIRSS